MGPKHDPQKGYDHTDNWTAGDHIVQMIANVLVFGVMGFVYFKYGDTIADWLRGFF
jgi:hypothetical protein